MQRDEQKQLNVWVTESKSVSHHQAAFDKTKTPEVKQSQTDSLDNSPMIGEDLPKNN